MLNRAWLPTTLLCLTCVAPTAQTSITIAEGNSLQAWTVREIDESAPTAPGRVVLRDLEFLPIEITNRTALQRADRPRRIDRSGLLRVELPGGGRLFQYRRRGGEQYGYLLVTANGAATVVLELPGTGVGGRNNPFDDRIGIAPDGRHAAIPTVRGGLYAAKLDGSNYASTQSPARPLSFTSTIEVTSICPGATQLFFATEDGKMWRCPLADGGQPGDVTPSGAATDTTEDELALAGDGRSVVFLFGPKDSVHLWRLGEQGAAVRLPPPAADYEEPGYLPENPEGPRLLLNDDGSRLMYTDGTIRDEIYLLDTTGATPQIHITSDANFQPYVGVGILPAFAQTTLIAAIGDPAAFDWYTADTQVGTPVNLTLTADEATPPYGAGKLAPFAIGATAADVTLVPETQVDGSLGLRRVDGATGTTSIIARRLRGTPVLGDAVDTPPHLLVPSFDGDRLLHDDGTPLLISLPGLAVAPDVAGTTGSFSVVRFSLGALSAPVLYLHTGVLLPLPADSALTQTTLTRGDGLLMNATTLRYFSAVRSATIPTNGTQVIVLSGAGS